MCDSVVALGSETRNGHALFAKNSDRSGSECQPLLGLPAAHHAPDTRLRCTHIEIPQVAETYAVLGHSPEWVWGLEHGVNEHGVAIGNHTVFSVEPLETGAGLIGMDLVRLGLERGRTAREALEVIATLLESFGQGGAAFGPEGAGYHNSFVLADSGNAWQLETSNRRWVARQLRLGACSNHYGLEADWDVAAHGFEAWAREAGLWQGEGRVDVASALRNPHVPPHVSAGRQRRARALLEGKRGALDREAFMALLRDHGSGGGVWTGGDATPSEERFFTLCAHSDPVHRTTASLVAELPARRCFGWPVWASFGTPCTGIFLPVYVDATLPAALARRRDGAEAPAAWPRFRRLDAAAERAPRRATPRLRAGWQELEQRIDTERSAVEREAHAVAEAGDRDGAAAGLSEFMARCVEAALTRAETLADELEAELPPLAEPLPAEPIA